MAGNEEAEKALLPKPVLTPLQQHFQQEGTAYMVALVDEKPASRWALRTSRLRWPGMCMMFLSQSLVHEVAAMGTGVCRQLQQHE